MVNVSYDTVNKQKQYKKPSALGKPTVSEHQSKWKYNGIIADQCKQKVVLCHIGLVRDHRGHLVQCFLIGWMVHPRVNKIFAGVNQPKGVNKGEPSGDQTEVMQ